MESINNAGCYLQPLDGGVRKAGCYERPAVSYQLEINKLKSELVYSRTMLVFATLTITLLTVALVWGVA